MSGFRPFKSSNSSNRIKELLGSGSHDSKPTTKRFRRPSVDLYPARKLHLAKVANKLPILGESFDTDIDSSSLAVPITKAISKKKASFSLALKRHKAMSETSKDSLKSKEVVKNKGTGDQQQFPVKKEKARVMRNAISSFRRK
jgi:hypothetical protein